MSNRLSELIYEDFQNSFDKEDSRLNQTPSFFKNFYQSSNPPFNSKIDEFHNRYSFLCITCGGVPELNISEKGKINYSCECEEEYKDLSIKEIYKHLFCSNDTDSRNKKLICNRDNNKYSYYCKKCKLNFCIKCSKDCKEHKNELIMFGIDDKDIKEKADYIIDRLKNKNTIKTNKISLIDESIITKNSQSNIENDINEEDENILVNISNINNENNDDIINIKNENNFEIYEEGNYNFINLFKIIINDYKNFPNYNNIKTISNIERFALLYFHDYNEIKLNYEFYEDNIKDNYEVELFGEIFVNNNKENCFLIIKENIMELVNSINLKNIFDVIYSVPPIYLDVQLIERKRKLMTNLSFMFNEISTITYKSNFYNYDTSNIKEMIYMFYNCKSLLLPNSIKKFKTQNVTNMSHMFCNCSRIKKLPDFTKWNTKNVTDMSSMFKNCSSLEEIPNNISKWNTENVKDMSNMFEKCSAITSLPDISKWNIKKVKYMNEMFRNCKNLSNAPFSFWKINSDTEIDKMFEGDTALENLPKFKKNKNNLFDCCLGFNKYKLLLMILFIGSFFAFGILYALTSFFIPYVKMNNLDNIKKSINNPIEYFDLLNNTNINISYIAELKKITDESIIEIMSKNKELTIKQILNFTLINSNTTFDSDYDIYKIYNIIIKYTSLFCLIFFIFTIFNIKYQFKCLNSAKSIYILIIIFFCDIFSFILYFKYFFINLKLFDSINEYFDRIKNIFKIEIPKVNNDEFHYLNFSLIPISIIFFIQIPTFIYIFIFCSEIHDIREKEKKLFYIKLKINC